MRCNRSNGNGADFIDWWSISDGVWLKWACPENEWNIGFDHVTFGEVAMLRHLAADLSGSPGARAVSDLRTADIDVSSWPSHSAHSTLLSQQISFILNDSPNFNGILKLWLMIPVECCNLVNSFRCEDGEYFEWFDIDAWNCDACEWTSFTHKNGSQVVLKSRVRATRWELNLSAGSIDGHISCCRENNLVALDLFTFKWQEQGVWPINQNVIRTTQVPPEGLTQINLLKNF
jgi:hypothetical protein